MRVYCRSGRLRCGRFWMAFQQRSKLGLKGQGVSRVTPSRGWGPTLPHTWRAQKAWILRATSSAFQYSAPMPPCRQRSPIICRKRTVPSYRHNTLSPHVPIVLHIHDHSVPPCAPQPTRPQALLHSPPPLHSVYSIDCTPLSIPLPQIKRFLHLCPHPKIDFIPQCPKFQDGSPCSASTLLDVGELDRFGETAPDRSVFALPRELFALFARRFFFPSRSDDFGVRAEVAALAEYLDVEMISLASFEVSISLNARSDAK